MSAFDRQNSERDAAAWIARLQSRSVSTHDLADFARWRRDPRNAAAYEQAEMFWDGCDELNDDPEIASAVRMAARAPAIGMRPAPRWRLFVRVAGGLLACLIAGLLLLPVFRGEQPTNFTTVIGERSVLRLEDGTRVQLDTDSDISANADRSARRVTLTKGRAYFEVRHDAARPFQVRADGVTVTAIGTKFDVFRHDHDVDVVLYQGSVLVAAASGDARVTLKPGQQITLRDGRLTRPVAILPNEAGLWRSGRVAFSNTSLNDAIAELNRYTDRPLRLARSSLGDDPISGDFTADDADGFTAAANALYGPGTVVRTQKVE